MDLRVAHHPLCDSIAAPSDADLTHHVCSSMTLDAFARGVHFILGPGMSIYPRVRTQLRRPVPRLARGGGDDWAETLAIGSNSERFARILKVFQDAHAEVRRRLHQHGIKH